MFTEYEFHLDPRLNVQLQPPSWPGVNFNPYTGDQSSGYEFGSPPDISAENAALQASITSFAAHSIPILNTFLTITDPKSTELDLVLAVTQDVLTIATAGLGTVLSGTATEARAFSGTVFELKDIPKHLENTAQSLNLIRREGAAHVFVDKETFAKVENTIFQEGRFTGTVRGTDRFRVMFKEPTGYRIDWE